MYELSPGYGAELPVPAPLLVREPTPGWEAHESARSPEPDAASSESDALDELGYRIAELSAHIEAATQRLLELVAEFDRRRGWELAGFRSCAHWLSERTGIDLGAARERVRTARALDRLPRTREAMGRGELSYSQVRALTRVATEANEEDLLEVARESSTAVLERVVRGWRRGTPEEEGERERRLWESRRFSVVPDGEGMYEVRGRLPAEVAGVLMRAVEAASDALFRDQGAPGWETEEERGRAASRRRADAVGLVAERALAAGFGGEGVPVSGSRAERYQVLLHVEEGVLRGGEGEGEGEDEAGGRSELEDGTRVSAETSRRLCCDASVVEVRMRGAGGAGGAASGTPLDVGRQRRTVSPALRRALEVRDRGCRFPGCGLRFTDAHHIRHWAQGGETSLSNCVLLCRFHHRLVHEGGWRVQWRGEGKLGFVDPRGGVHLEGRRRGAPSIHPDRRVDLVEWNRARGIRPDGWTASVRWTRDSDIPWPLLARMFEALEGGGGGGRGEGGKRSEGGERGEAGLGPAQPPPEGPGPVT